MGSVIPVDDHIPAGLAEGDLILLGDLIQHAAGGQRDGEVALIAAAALDHADEGIQLGVEGGGFILDGDGLRLLATQAERQGGHGIPFADEDGALFALDGGGEGAIGDFAPAPIRQEGGVLGQRAALGLELTELIAAGEELLGFAGHGDGGGDAVDTEIGDGGIIQAGIEGIGAAAGKVAIVPTGILAVARGDAAQGADLRDELVQPGEAGGEQGAHALQQDDMAIVRLQHHAVTIDVGGGHGLFAQDVLAGLHQRHGLLGVAEIGAGDIDGIDERTAGHLFERGERMRNPVLRGEGIGRSLIARTDRRRLEARVLPGAGKHPVGDKARTDHSETNLSFHTYAVNILL